MEEENNQGTKFNRKLINKVKFYTLVALLLQIAGFSTPGWSVRKIINGISTPADVYIIEHYQHLSLWYRVICRTGRICKLLTIFSKEYEEYKLVLEQEVACTIAVILTSISLVLVVLINQKTPFRNAFCRLVGAMVLGVLSAAVSFYAIGTRARDEIQFATKTTQIPVTVLFPYSIFIFGVGALALCVAFLISATHVFQVNRKRQKELRPRMPSPSVTNGECNGCQQSKGDNVNNDAKDSGSAAIGKHNKGDDSGPRKY